MHWLRFTHGLRGGFGTLDGAQVRVHAGDMFGENRPTGETIPADAIEWLTPCVPSKFVCLWNNFHAAAARQGLAIPAEPLYVIKAASAACAHGRPIVAPAPRAYDGRVVYEGELGIVIGRRCRDVGEADALAHVFGYTCTNDVTAIELIQRDPAFPQWTRAKSFDTFGAFGPVIATHVDLGSASVRTRVGGRERQNYPLSDMIFDPARLVARLSREMTLEPGDLISCGTSLGVLPMKPGTRVEVEIDGIGVLANDYIANEERS